MQQTAFKQVLFNEKFNREIENESISHPLECCLAPPRGASTPGWETLI